MQRAGAAVCVLRFRAGRFVIESILYEADKAHHEPGHRRQQEAHPELYRDGAGPDVMTAADWQAKYPLLNMEQRGEPTRYDLGLPADREAARDDPELELGLTDPDPVAALPAQLEELRGRCWALRVVPARSGPAWRPAPGRS